MPFDGFEYPNSTFVPNIVFDELLPDLSGEELRCLLYICRHTFGYGKKTDAIALSQFQQGIVAADGRIIDRGTGLSKSAVARGLKGLIEKGIITAERQRSAIHGNLPTVYRPRFQGAPLVSHEGQASPTEPAPLVPPAYPQKKTSQEEDLAEENRLKRWESVKVNLLTAQRMSQTNFTTWIAETRLCHENAQELVIQAPTSTHAEWLQQRLAELILKAYSDVHGVRPQRLQVLVAQEAAS